MADVGAHMRQMYAIFPRGQRGPQQMRALYEATRGEFSALMDAYREANPSGIWAGRELFDADAQRFEERMAHYDQAIMRAQEAAGIVDEDAFQESISGFFVGRYPGHSHIPDFAAPRSFANQLEALGVASQQNTFTRALVESSKEAPELMGRVIGQTAHAVGKGAGHIASGFASNAGLWGLALIVGSIYLYARTRNPAPRIAVAQLSPEGG